MTIDDWPEWLPADWIIQIRKIDDRKVKCFIDPKGQKFYSKPQVERHLKNNTASETTQNADVPNLDLSLDPDVFTETNEDPVSTPQGQSTRSRRPASSGKTYKEIEDGSRGRKEDDCSWLPEGWNMEVKTKNTGQKYKVFISPNGKKKLFSKPQVMNYLASNEQNGPTLDLSIDPVVFTETNEDHESTPQGQLSRVRRPGSSGKKYKETEDETPNERDPRGRKENDYSWLPEGWKMEVKTKSSGQKFKVFIDPNGKKFFSKPQVMKHLGIEDGGKTSTEPEQSLISEPIEANKNEPLNVVPESVRMPPDYEVISSTPAEGLPPGWIKEIRMRLHGSAKKKDPYYLDPSSGYVFFSKLDALRYLDTGDIKKCAMKPLRRDTIPEKPQIVDMNEEDVASPPEPSKEPETSKSIINGNVIEPTTDASASEKRKARSIIGDGLIPDPKDEAWLPEGWVVEFIHRKNGMKIKLYKEISTDKKFYSKPQVESYLATGSGTKKPTPKTKKRKMKARKSYTDQDSESESDNDKGLQKSKKTKTPTDLSDFKATIVTSPAEGLPPGWIKEIRSRLCAGAIRKDPYYIDPVSGYVFRSKLDAMRYLDTGDINLCAIRPRKKDADGNEVAIPYDTLVAKPKKKDLFEGVVASDAEPMDTDKETQTPKNTENTPTTGRPKRPTRERAVKSKPASASASASPPARTSTRLKSGIKPHPKTNTTSNDENAPQPDNGVGNEKDVGARVDVEKQGEDAGENLDYQLEDDSSWTHQFDFAVKTLVGEFPPNESGGVGNGSPAKV